MENNRHSNYSETGSSYIRKGNVVRRIRVKMGMTQRDFAAQMGISVTALGKLERGITQIKSGHIEKLCRISGLSEQEVLFGEDYEISSSLEDKHILEELHTKELARRDATISRQAERIFELEDIVSKKEAEIADLKHEIETLKQIQQKLEERLDEQAGTTPG